MAEREKNEAEISTRAFPLESPSNYWFYCFSKHNFHLHGDFHFVTPVMRNGMCNLVAPGVDGVVVLVAVRTSQLATIPSWSSHYILVRRNVKLKSNYVITATDRSSSA